MILTESERDNVEWLLKEAFQHWYDNHSHNNDLKTYNSIRDSIKHYIHKHISVRS